MVEKSSLPDDALALSDPSFPCSDNIGHPLISFETHDGVDVVGHGEKQAAVPVSLFLSMNNGFKDCVPSSIRCQLICAALLTVDGDEERWVA